MFPEHLGHQSEAVANGHHWATGPSPACTAPPRYTSLPKSRLSVTIAWIGLFSRVEDVVTLGAQPFGQPSACAVDEELHRLATETAASVSSAIAACA